MHHMLGSFRIDVDAWKNAIEADRQAHAEAGLRFNQVWRNVDDPEQIFFLFEVDDLERGKKFLAEAGALEKDKQACGEIPKLTFLEPA